MSTDSIVKRAVEFILKARQEEDEKPEEAIRLFIIGIEHFLHAITYGRHRDSLKEHMRRQCDHYLDEVEKLQQSLNVDHQGRRNPLQRPEASYSKSPPSTKQYSSRGETNTSHCNEDTDTENLLHQLKGALLTESPNVSWADVAGLEGVKTTLKEVVFLPIKFPFLFQEERKPWKAILLFGPPGTGKTHLAKAVATEANNSRFFAVSSSTLVSKYVGESEKLIFNLFQLARDNKPSIIFIDEIDSLCSARSDQESESARRIKSEFLIQMQGVGSDDDGVLVLGATNIPWVLDAAIRRRFEKRVYIPLPEEIARLAIFKMRVGKTPNSLSEEDFKILAKKTEGFSGADIAVLVKDALYMPIRKVAEATHFLQVLGPSRADPNIYIRDLYTPCDSSTPGAIEMSFKDVPDDKLLEPIVTMSDMLVSLANTKKTVKDKDLLKLKQFLLDFGQEG